MANAFDSPSLVLCLQSLMLFRGPSNQSHIINYCSELSVVCIDIHSLPSVVVLCVLTLHIFFYCSHRSKEDEKYRMNVPSHKIKNGAK